MQSVRPPLRPATRTVAPPAKRTTAETFSPTAKALLHNAQAKPQKPVTAFSS